MIHRITLSVRFSVVPYIALFQYWIMDILFFVKSTVRSAQIRMLQFFKEKYFIFNKFQLNFLCFIVLKMKKVVTKSVVCFSNK